MRFVKFSVAVVLIPGAVLFAFGCSRAPDEAAKGAPASGSTLTEPLMPLTPGRTIGFARASGPARSVVERLGNTWSPEIKQPVPVTTGAPLTVAGWAVDAQQHQPAAGVDVLIDGMPFSAEYGIERADVADFLRMPACKKSGFQLMVPAYRIDRGRHQISLRVLSADGTVFRESPAIEFEVK